MQAAKHAFENTKHAAGKAVERVSGGSSESQNTGSTRHQSESHIKDEGRTSTHREFKEHPSRVGAAAVIDTRTENLHFEKPTVETKDTEVQELINPAVTHEKIKPSETLKNKTHLERDVHQDHYQTRVQPIVDKTVLPTQSETRNLPTEHREIKQKRAGDIDSRLAAEATQFKSSTTVHPTATTVQQGDVTAEEHRHHHVHEIIQPVIEREVIQPKVIHTNAKIHEEVEKEPTFHPKTVQPPMSLQEFERAGGSITKKDHPVKGKTEIFEGEPQVVENGGADQTYPNSYAKKESTTNK